MKVRIVLLTLICGFIVTNAFAEVINIPDTSTRTLTGTAGAYAAETVVNVGNFHCAGPEWAINSRNLTPNNPIGVVYIPLNTGTFLPNANLYETGTANLPGTQIIGDTRSAIGTYLAAAGDDDKDGCKDVLISSLGYGGGLYNPYVMLINGGKNLPNQINIQDITKTVRGAFFINVNAASIDAGDFNGDGFIDYMFGEITSGLIKIYKGNGNTSGIIDMNGPNIIILNTGTSGRVKAKFANLNGDKYKDIVFLTARRDGGEIFGTPALASATLNDAYFTGTNGSKLLANSIESIAPVGDMNGDNLDDVFFRGAQIYTSTLKNGLIFGSKTPSPITDLTTPDGKIWSRIDNLGAEFLSESGNSMSTAGSYNNDTYGDAFLGDPTKNQVWVLTGRKDWPAVVTLGDTDTKYVGTGVFATSVAFMDNALGGDGCGVNVAYNFGPPGYGYNVGKDYIVYKTK